MKSRKETRPERERADDDESPRPAKKAETRGSGWRVSLLGGGGGGRGCRVSVT